MARTRRPGSMDPFHSCTGRPSCAPYKVWNKFLNANYVNKGDHSNFKEGEPAYLGREKWLHEYTQYDCIYDRTVKKMALVLKETFGCVWLQSEVREQPRLVKKDLVFRPSEYFKNLFLCIGENAETLLDDESVGTDYDNELSSISDSSDEENL